MRLDKMISSTGIASRSQIASAVRGGRVIVDGVVARKADMQVDPDRVSVTYCGTPVCYRQFTYIMLNKPEGYVSATEDGRLPTVIGGELSRDYPSIAMYFFSGSCGFVSFFGICSDRIPCSSLALISSSVTSSPT